jgi:hypothetical protein
VLTCCSNNKSIEIYKRIKLYQIILLQEIKKFIKNSNLKIKNERPGYKINKTIRKFILVSKILLIILLTIQKCKNYFFFCQKSTIKNLGLNSSNDLANEIYRKFKISVSASYVRKLRRDLSELMNAASNLTNLLLFRICI